MEPISLASAGIATAKVTKTIVDGNDPSIIDIAFVTATSTGFSSLGASAPQLDSTTDLTGIAIDTPAVSPEPNKIVVKGVGIENTYISQGPETAISDVSVTLSDGAQQRTLLTQQFVADSRYAHIGNLLDFATQVKNGELPDLDILLRAVVDVVDLATLTLLRPFLIQYKLNPHLHTLIKKKTQTVFEDVAERQGYDNDHKSDIVSREEKIEDIGTFTQRTSFKETRTSNQTEIRTRVIQESEYSYLLDASPPEQTPNFTNVLVPAEAYDKLLFSAKHYTENHHARVQSITSEMTRVDITEGAQTENSVLGWRLGKILGKVEEDSVTDSTVSRSHHAVEQDLDGVDLASARQSGVKITPGAVEKLGGTTLREINVADSDITNRTITPGQFQEGLASYTPFLGGIINTGVKQGLGATVSKSDIFWAAMDIVEIAVLIATLGTASPFFAAGKTAAKAGAKQVGKAIAKQGAEVAGKTVSRELGQEAVEAGTKKLISKETAKAATRETGEQVAKSTAIKTTSEQVTKSAAEDVSEAVAKKSAKKIGHEASEEAVESSAKHGRSKPHGNAPDSGKPNNTQTNANPKTRTGATGNQKSGGAYSDVKAKGHHAHHMPANDASPLPKEQGPAIKMDPKDHRKTASYGNSKEARAHREKQRELIEQGKFKDAQKMDIDDIKSKFGSKYDKQIEEMLEYTDNIDLPKAQKT